jgi:DegV family protein with EDD domain
MTIAIVTDSTSDIPHDLADKFNIQIIPTILVINDRSIEDDRQFSRELYYNELPQMANLPTTAAPGIGKFEEVYKMLFDSGYKQVLSIHVAGNLSGVYNAAHAGAQAFEGRVIVVDSEQLSMGLGFQAIAAAESALEGASLQAILQRIATVRQNTHLIAMLDTLEYIRRSGRVSWARAAIGTILRLKPFIKVTDGRVLRLGEARTRKKGIDRLVDMLNEIEKFTRLAILHTNAEQDAFEFRDRLNIPPHVEPILVNITPVIGTHVGPNGLGFVAITEG